MGSTGNIPPQAIIELEACEIPELYKDRLKTFLKEYIDANRGAAVRDEHIIIASAIRKWVSLLGQNELDEVGRLLNADSGISFSIDLELEILKSALWSLTWYYYPEDSLPVLEQETFKIARLYLHDHFLHRPKYGVVALQIVQILLLVHSEYFTNILEMIGALQTGWFKQLLLRETSGVYEEISSLYPSDSRSRIAALLKDLNATLETETGK